MAADNLGGKHIIVYRKRMTHIITKTVFQNSKGYFILNAAGRRQTVDKLPHNRNLNGFDCSFTLDRTT